MFKESIDYLFTCILKVYFKLLFNLSLSSGIDSLYSFTVKTFVTVFFFQVAKND